MFETAKMGRDILRSISTQDDLASFLESLTISQNDRMIASMIYGKGYSIKDVSARTGWSGRSVSRAINRVQIKAANANRFSV